MFPVRLPKLMFLDFEFEASNLKAYKIIEQGRHLAFISKRMNRLTMFVRTALATSHNPMPVFRFYCSASSSAPALANNKLFVAGLSWSVDERSLLDAFSNFGEVTEVRIMYDKATGRSRGFGFVYFAKDDDAQSAKDAMDGKALLGRPLRITFALEKVRGAPIVVPRIRGSEDAVRPKN